MNNLLRGSVGAAAAMLLVGTLAAVSSVINHYPLYGGQALRYALAAAILFAVARAKGLGLVRLTLREGLLLLALAATGLVLFNVCVIQATRHASPTLVGTTVGTVPVVLALVGPLLARSRPSGRVLAAATVVVAGATITTGLGSGSLTGLLYAIGALASEACFSLLAVPLLPKLGPIRVSAYTQAAAVPSLLIVAVIADGSGILRTPSAAEAAALVYLGTVVSAGGFFLWYDALPRLGADHAGLFAGMVPVGAIITAAVLGLGTPTATELGGTALVIAGLTVGLVPSRPYPRQSPQQRQHPTAELLQGAVVLLRQVVHGMASVLGRPPIQLLGELRIWLAGGDQDGQASSGTEPRRAPPANVADAHHDDHHLDDLDTGGEERGDEDRGVAHGEVPVSGPVCSYSEPVIS
jgi:drug/metabolite transporter (DMT)-like permease